jgi:hypothetical protein
MEKEKLSYTLRPLALNVLLHRPPGKGRSAPRWRPSSMPEISDRASRGGHHARIQRKLALIFRGGFRSRKNSGRSVTNRN